MGRLCLGGVEGLTGRGKLFLRENEESRLRGERSEVSVDMVEAGEKNVAGDCAPPAAPQLLGSEGVTPALDTPPLPPPAAPNAGDMKLLRDFSKVAGAGDGSAHL